MVYAKVFRRYFFNLLMSINKIITNVTKLNLPPIFVPIAHFLLSLYYKYCGLSPCTVDLDDQTTMHFWISNHKRHGRPNLVLIHGCGGDARWQFLPQIGSLSKSFNIYMPDLLFFGESYTKNKDRTPSYQAKCIMEGLKKGFGVKKCTVYSISYGGWVGYSMAEMYPCVVEMNVIVSCGVGTTVDQKQDQLIRVGMQLDEVLQVVVPKDPDAIRLLVQKAVYKHDLTKWAPNFILWEFIKTSSIETPYFRLKSVAKHHQTIENKNRKEKEELMKCVMFEDLDSKISALSQETLLVWGDQDYFFPKEIGHQLQRKLGPKSRLMIIKETGHAINIDSPKELNELIKSFVFGQLDR